MEAPSLASIAQIGLSVAACALGGPMASIALNMVDDVVMVSQGLIEGTMTWDEAGVNMLRGTASAVAGAYVSDAFGAATNSISNTVGGAVLKTVMGVGSMASKNLVMGSIDAIKYSAGGNFNYDGDYLRESLIGEQALVGYLGGAAATFVTESMSALTLGKEIIENGQFVGYENALNMGAKEIGYMKSFNSLLGNTAHMGVEFAMTGESTVNLLNFNNIANWFGMDWFKGSVGMLEMHIGGDGLNFSLGTGGIDMSVGKIIDAIKGIGTNIDNKRIMDAAKNNIVEGDASYEEKAATLRGEYSFGEEVGKEKVNDIIEGKIKLTIGTKWRDKIGYYEDNPYKVDGNNIYMDSGFKPDAWSYLVGTTVLHKAFNDSQVINAHEEIAQRMMNDKGIVGNMVGLSNAFFMEEVKKTQIGGDAFKKYWDKDYINALNAVELDQNSSQKNSGYIIEDRFWDFDGYGNAKAGEYDDDFNGGIDRRDNLWDLATLISDDGRYWRFIDVGNYKGSVEALEPGTIVNYLGIYPKTTNYECTLKATTPDEINFKTIVGVKLYKDRNKTIPFMNPGQIQAVVPDVQHVWFNLREKNVIGDSFGLGHYGPPLDVLFSGVDVKGAVLTNDDASRPSRREELPFNISENMYKLMLKRSNLAIIYPPDYNLDSSYFKHIGIYNQNNDEYIMPGGFNIPKEDLNGMMCATWAVDSLMSGGIPLGVKIDIKNWDNWNATEMIKAYNNGTLLAVDVPNTRLKNLRPVYTKTIDSWINVKEASPAEIFKRILEYNKIYNNNNVLLPNWDKIINSSTYLNWQGN